MEMVTMKEPYTIKKLQEEWTARLRAMPDDRIIGNAIDRLETLEFQIEEARKDPERMPDLWFEAQEESAFCALAYLREWQRRCQS